MKNERITPMLFCTGHSELVGKTLDKEGNRIKTADIMPVETDERK